MDEDSISDIPLLYFYISIGVLLFLSAMVSGSEMAFFSLKPEEINQTKKKGSGRIIALLLKKSKELLATVLITNNLINIAIITISTMIAWVMIARGMGKWLLVIIPSLITVLILFFGEIIPKVIAQHAPLKFGRFTARMIYVCSVVFRPIIKFLLYIDSKVSSYGEKRKWTSINELEKAVELTTETSTKEQKEILNRAIRFGAKTVRDVMRPRHDIVSIDSTDTFEQVIKKIRTTSYSRIPVYKEFVDNIVGILYVKDVIYHIHSKADIKNFSWQDIIKKNVFYVPENKPADELLRDFQKRRVHIAIVVDEYGGVLGLVTMEDIIEEITGDIMDEFDQEKRSLKRSFYKISDTQFRFQADISLDDFYEVMGVERDTFNEIGNKSEALSGLVLEIFTYLPKADEEVVYKNFKFKVRQVNSRRIQIIDVFIQPE